MKKRSLCLSIMFLLSLIWAASAYAEQKGNLRYSITVSKFKNQSNWAGQLELGNTFGAMLTDSLQQSGKFIVLGEKEMRAEAIAEQDFADSGRVAGGKKKPQIGQMTPAQLLVKGEITHFQHSTTGGSGGISVKGFKLGGNKDEAQINAVVYVVDSTTGQVKASKKVVGEATRLGVDVAFSDKNWAADLAGFKKTNVGRAVEKAIDEAVAFISQEIEDIPCTGSVIQVKGDQIYLNRKSREGVTKGQTFVVGNVEELRDTDTGELLDESMEKAGTIVVESVKEKTATAKAIEGAGKIQKGMTITLP